MDLLLLPLLFVAMWFFLIRPQQQRVKAQRAVLASLTAGDRVVTAGGIIGTITQLGDEEMRLQVGPNVELQVLRGAVSRRLDPPGRADEADEADAGAGE